MRLIVKAPIKQQFRKQQVLTEFVTETNAACKNRVPPFVKKCLDISIHAHARGQSFCIC